MNRILYYKLDKRYKDDFAPIYYKGPFWAFWGHWLFSELFHYCLVIATWFEGFTKKISS